MSSGEFDATSDNFLKEFGFRWVQMGSDGFRWRLVLVQVGFTYG